MGLWRRRIKYFFWSTMFSGVVLVYGSQSPDFQLKFIEGLNAVKGKAYSFTHNGARMPTHLSVGFNPNKYVKSEGSGPVELVTPPKMLDIQADSERRVSSSSNEYGDSSGNYVLIKGKYYQARADNIYEVDGERIFYINNRKKQQLEDQVKEGKSKEQMELSSKLGSLPMSPEEAAKMLKGAQEATRKRNEYLDKMEYQ